MFQLSFKIDTLKFDESGYSKTVKKFAEVALRNAARRFIREAIQSVPVQTGMARGSYLNVGRLLRVAIKINPTVFGAKYHGQPKTPELGASLSEFGFRNQGDLYIFEFGTDVEHYNINEFFGGHSPSAPWFSFDKGRKAAEKYLLQDLPNRFPHIKDYLIVTTVTGGPNGVSRTSHRLKSGQVALLEDI